MGISDDFRARAKDQIAASAPLFEEPDFGTNAKKQALAIIGQVNANTLLALADLADVQIAQGHSALMSDRARKAFARNDLLRKAAAAGRWDLYDQLINDAAGELGANPGGGTAPADNAGGNSGGTSPA